MSTSTLNIINNYLINYNKELRKNIFNNRTKVKPTKTIFLEDTIITYSSKLEVIFCSICKKNLTKNNYIRHLKEKHSTIFKDYKNTNKLENLNLKISSLDLAILEDLKAKIEPAKYYFKDLDININGFKCLECNYININSKEIRKHYNLEYNRRENRTNLKADYYINLVPLQVLKGFKAANKIYFISKLPRLNKLTARELKNLNKLKEDFNLEEEDSNLEEEDTNNNLENIYNLEEIEELEREDINLETRRYSLDSISIDSSSTIEDNIANLEDNRRELTLSIYSNNIKEKDTNLDFTINLDLNTKLLNSFTKKSKILEYLENKDRDLLSSLVYKSTALEDNSRLNSLDLFTIDSSFNRV